MPNLDYKGLKLHLAFAQQGREASLALTCLLSWNFILSLAYVCFYFLKFSNYELRLLSQPFLGEKNIY